MVLAEAENIILTIFRPEEISKSVSPFLKLQGDLS